MNYVTFGRTGLKVSPLSLGCLNFGPTTGESESVAVIGRAVELGINVLDVADVYGGGDNERVVGRALRELGCRERMIVATKFTGRIADADPADPNAEGASRHHVLRACEDSLRRLRVDHIDLYQLHSPRYDVAADETLRALEDLIRAGKIRYAGSCNDPAWKLAAATAPLNGSCPALQMTASWVRPLRATPRAAMPRRGTPRRHARRSGCAPSWTLPSYSGIPHLAVMAVARPSKSRKQSCTAWTWAPRAPSAARSWNIGLRASCAIGMRLR